MRMTVLICVVGALLAPTAAPADSATVIAATATSMGPHAAPVNCLLQPDCAGSWSPGSADSGANEGVYVQFETPVAADSIELVTSVKDADAPFTLSVNGEPHPAAKSARDAGSGKYARSYATPGGRIKSIFFRLGVRKGGWQNFSLYSIQFYRQGKPVELTLPVLVPATVVASSVLEPKVAYQPANLFDSRYDFAWSTNGQTTSGKGESVEIRFSQPQSLSGMIVWNGYQRSETHFKANGRVARISVSDGHVSSSFALSDTMGGQQVAFTNPLKNVSSLKLTIESVTAGAKYPDVLLSELRLLDDHNQILIPQVKGMQPEASPMTAAFVDRSFSSVVCASSVTPGDFQRSLRLRGDGSFVIYGKAYDDEEKKRTDQVLEGNW